MHVDMPRARDGLTCLRVSTWTTLLSHIHVVQLIQILFVHFNMAQGIIAHKYLTRVN